MQAAMKFSRQSRRLSLRGARRETETVSKGHRSRRDSGLAVGLKGGCSGGSLTAPSPQPTPSRVLFLGGWLLLPFGMQGKYPELRLVVQVLRTQARLICPRRGLSPPKTWCSRCGVGAQPHPHLTSSPRLGPWQPFQAWFHIQGLNTRRPQLFKAFTLVR